MLIHADAEASLRALAAWYSEELRRRYASSAVRALARTTLPRLCAFLEKRGVREAREVNEAHLVAFAAAMAGAHTRDGKSLSLWTLSAYVAAVKRFFRFLASAHVLLFDPARGLSVSTGRRLPRARLNPQQARRLLEAPGTHTTSGLRDRAILEVLYGTGLRVRECERLDVTDVDLGAGTLFIKNGKGRRDRLVPVVGRAAAALDVYLRDARPVLARQAGEVALFLTYGGLRLGLQSIEILVRRHAHAAGLPVRVTPHTLRHACATHLLQGGASVRHVQRLLGHVRLATTALYTRVDVGDLAQVLARTHPRERRRHPRERKRR